MSAVQHLVDGRARDLGDGFHVRRVLPAPARAPMVGPFIFFDHMGPATFAPGPAINVRPHPHIALATVTYLFSGEIRHRDSLGYDQEIRPGDVNWMVAGRGIVHSERTTDGTFARGTTLHGIQSWVALPDGHEDDPPSFHHHPAATLPHIVTPDGVELRVIAGDAFGRRSPVTTNWPTLYADAVVPAGARFELGAEHEQRAVYAAVGSIVLHASGEPPQPLRSGQLAVLAPGVDVTIEGGGAGGEPSRAMLLGGAAFPKPRLIWWNFVASTQERIDAAKRDWAARDAQRFPLVPGDDQEFIPLP